MAWQDELRRLDEELAAGRLSAEEYRQLRDALLASQGQPVPTPQPAEEQPASPSPFPPPFKWEGSDSTQVMRPASGPAGSGADAGSDTTQVVPNQAAADADRTQVVHGSAPRQQGYPAPGWPQQGGDHGQYAPPWGSSELPSLSQEPTWLRQGPEVFDSDSKSNTGTILTVVAAVLVVLLGAGAVYWFGFRNGEGTQPVATTTNQPTTVTTTTIPKPDGPFVDIDGKIILNRTLTMAEAAQEGKPSKTEIETLTSGGTEKIAVFLTEADDGTRTGIWTFTPRAGANAQQLLDGIDQLYERARFQALPPPAAGVLARFQQAEPRATYRAHYLHRGIVVRVESVGDNKADAERQFNELLGRQLDDFPVG